MGLWQVRRRPRHVRGRHQRPRDGAQRSAYQRWQNLRSKELINPAVAQTLLTAWGDKVKMPIFIEADINGNEYEGTDAMMQVSAT